MAMTRMTVMCAILFSLSLAGDCPAGEPVEDLLAATFRMTFREHSGTCFLVAGQAEDAANPRKVILVTAAHVLEQMSGPECELILREGMPEEGYRRKVFPIAIREGEKPRWTRHPEVDVAALRIELPEDVATKPLALDQIASEEQVVNKTVRVGQDAWISCFPAKLESNEAGWPVLKKGSIATHPLTPVKNVKTMLIDYTVFLGDSGAPVAIVSNGQLLIIGVQSSMQRQTDRATLPFEERTMHTPLGLSNAVQSAYLRETIDLLMSK